MSPIPMPDIFSQILPRAATLYARDEPTSSTDKSLPWYGIAGIILLVLALLFSITLVSLRIVRQRRKDALNRDSFVPNNFKIVGSLSSILDSRRTSRANSIYKPTNEYGQYRAPPLPKPAHVHARSVSHSNLLHSTSPV